MNADPLLFLLIGFGIFMAVISGIAVLGTIENIRIAKHTGRDPRAKHIEATGDGVEVAERMAREGKL